MATDQREAWLEKMMPYVTTHFESVGYKVPKDIRVSCGWPHKGGIAKRKQRIGECWDSKLTTDNHFLIFISPILDEPVKVVGVLIHEVVHAVVGLKVSHKKPFATCAAMVGLTAPWTGTGETDELKSTIKGWIAKVGPYPHGAIKPRAMQAEQEKGRMLLLECECGLKIRSTQKWIDLYGQRWPCACGSKLVVQ